MESLYKPDGVEARWQEPGRRRVTTRPGRAPARDESYVICVPPPNVTGELHMATR